MNTTKSFLATLLEFKTTTDEVEAFSKAYPENLLRRQARFFYHCVGAGIAILAVLATESKYIGLEIFAKYLHHYVGILSGFLFVVGISFGLLVMIAGTAIHKGGWVNAFSFVIFVLIILVVASLFSTDRFALPIPVYIFADNKVIEAAVSFFIIAYLIYLLCWIIFSNFLCYISKIHIYRIDQLISFMLLFSLSFAIYAAQNDIRGVVDDVPAKLFVATTLALRIFKTSLEVFFIRRDEALRDARGTPVSMAS